MLWLASACVLHSWSQTRRTRRRSISSESDILIATNEGVNWGYSTPDGWGPPQSLPNGMDQFQR